MSNVNIPEQDMELDESRLALAKDPKTAPSILKDLTKDPDWRVRQHVAMNPATPEGCLWDLAYDNVPCVSSEAFKSIDALGLRAPGYKVPILAQIHYAEKAAQAQQNTPSAKAGPER